MANGEALAYKQPAIRLVNKSGMLEEAEPQGPGFLERRALDLGIMTMVQPTKPYWSTTMVTAWVAVMGFIVVLLGAIGGLYVYTRDTNLKIGKDQGIQEEKDRQRDAQILNLQRELRLDKDGQPIPDPTPAPKGRK